MTVTRRSLLIFLYILECVCGTTGTKGSGRSQDLISSWNASPLLLVTSAPLYATSISRASGEVTCKAWKSSKSMRSACETVIISALREPGWPRSVGASGGGGTRMVSKLHQANVPTRSVLLGMVRALVPESLGCSRQGQERSGLATGIGNSQMTFERCWGMTIVVEVHDEKEVCWRKWDCHLCTLCLTLGWTVRISSWKEDS